MIFRDHNDKIRLIFDNGRNVDIWFSSITKASPIRQTILVNEKGMPSVYFENANALVSYLGERAK